MNISYFTLLRHYLHEVETLIKVKELAAAAEAEGESGD
jgi:hypothetical protein